jgi:hypothetical protein
MRRLLVITAGIALVATACASNTPDTATSTTVAAAETASTTPPTTASPPTTATSTTTSAAPTTTTTTAPPIEVLPVVPGEDADADAIVNLFAVVFSSTTAYDKKAPLITNADALEETIEKYNAAGEGVGGLELNVTAVGLGTDAAVVIYDLYFGENPFQTDQEGNAVFSEAGWQVTRAYFCSIAELARVECF